MFAPSHPINNRVVTSWFPERERAAAIGFYTSGQFVGIAFLTPVLVWKFREGEPFRVLVYSALR